MKADLHNHSSYSDGTLNIEQMDEYAQSKNLDFIAITDHDTVKVINDLKNNSYKTKILVGTELSSELNGESVHILGYFYNNEVPQDIIKYLNQRVIDRKERVYKILERLKEFYDIDITYKDVLFYGFGALDESFEPEAIGRPHIAEAISKKYLISFDEVFERYIGSGKKAYIPTNEAHTKDMIDLLKNNNALVVIAHPVHIKKNSIEEIIGYGVDGIEARYPDNEEADTTRFLELAERYKLLVTGGSDFHGPQRTGSRGDMGQCYIEGKELELFLGRVFK